MIGIIFSGNIEYCPYVDKYIYALNNSSINYEILYWNRDLLEKNNVYNNQSFEHSIDNSKSKNFKIIDFFMFRNWLMRKLKLKKYKKIIILDTLSGILISGFLKKNYYKKYIFDIRDYTYEDNKCFFNLEKNIIEKSFFTCISSEGFKEFLPRKHEYILAHNFNYNDVVQKSNGFEKKKYGESINIVWIGSVRYFYHQIKIINNLKNDERFNIIFHGSGPDLKRLISYCESNDIKNVLFTGRYKNNGKRDLLSNADILLNSYDINVGKEVKYAISNKYYDGIIYKIPQLVEVGTYKQELVEDKLIGIGIDVNNTSFADKLLDYYYSIDVSKFNNSCIEELNTVIEEDRIYQEKIYSFIENSQVRR